MGSIEYKVNERKVGEIVFRNVKHIEDDMYLYSYSVYKGKEEPFHSGTCVHQRKDGIFKLGSIIIMDMNIDNIDHGFQTTEKT